MGSDRLFTPEVESLAGPAADGFLVTAGPNADEFSFRYANHFVPAYTLKYGSSPNPWGYAPYSYDSFLLIKAAIKSAAVPQLPAGTLQIGRQALRDALYGTTDLAGLTGKLSCSPTGDCADLSTSMAVFEYDTAISEFVKIWP
jgi:branched-chain amino acid transport system substrate-binding protein